MVMVVVVIIMVVVPIKAKNKIEGSWKNKIKKTVKTTNGFKTIMSVLAQEESTN